VPAAHGLGALSLAGEAAVHAQQCAARFHGVRWIGLLFLASAVAIVTAIAGVVLPRTRQIAAPAGVVISALAAAASPLMVTVPCKQRVGAPDAAAPGQQTLCGRSPILRPQLAHIVRVLPFRKLA
jgi:hypothetical protein